MKKIKEASLVLFPPEADVLKLSSIRRLRRYRACVGHLKESPAV